MKVDEFLKECSTKNEAGQYEFAAYARTALPALVKMVEEQRKLLEHIQERFPGGLWAYTEPDQNGPYMWKTLNEVIDAALTVEVEVDEDGH